MSMYKVLSSIMLICLCINLQAHAFQRATPLTNDVTLDVMIGQMIITGIGDQSYMRESDPILDDIKAGRVGGVIFFEKNINRNSPAEQMKRSIEMMKGAANIPLFVSIDEEGGKVNRLKTKYGFPATKTAEYLGKVDKLDTTAYYANQTASILHALGFNLNYAPDVDVAIYADNPVIAKIGRSYSADASQVVKHASEVVRVHRENQVMTVLKHFPGHGSSHADSHLGVADVTNYWQFSELLPYKAMLDSGMVDAIMTAHIVNKHMDANGLPATLSPYIVNDVLRGFLGYNGVVFSDDMQMHAISSNYGFEESIKLSILAGVDVLMFANNVPGNEKRTAKEIHAIIKGYVEGGQISEQRIRESYDRIMRMKSKL
ncbi:glycoside hydrolase family 3 protein [Reichenbachiella agarivorans]|uniref:beta-N-acetylhexosaminidase n=1 Tax=Reichenbachiella agarivorans TaxID=2979464 RepID=A0ABY6CSQ2_9BACT|nr:glycoside hydrolase family 3 N-terminal domain-containing protein [Reichenbachiella agarivorans]UXP33542.1 glycoside hydrolase family 3 protein [Reichenbachiella agarivorans]